MSLPLPPACKSVDKEIVCKSVDRKIGPATARAIHCISNLACRAVHTDHQVEFLVNAQKQPDGSLVVNVLHPEGALIFDIPREEMELDISR